MRSERFDWFRLTLRLHRFGFAFGVAIIGLVVASFVAAATEASNPPECTAFGGGERSACAIGYRKLSDAQVIGGLVMSPPCSSCSRWACSWSRSSPASRAGTVRLACG
jgi:hypothetical protein